MCVCVSVPLYLSLCLTARVYIRGVFVVVEGLHLCVCMFIVKCVRTVKEHQLCLVCLFPRAVCEVTCISTCK